MLKKLQALHEDGEASKEALAALMKETGLKAVPVLMSIPHFNIFKDILLVCNCCQIENFTSYPLYISPFRIWRIH